MCFILSFCELGVGGLALVGGKSASFGDVLSKLSPLGAVQVRFVNDDEEKHRLVRSARVPHDEQARWPLGDDEHARWSLGGDDEVLERARPARAAAQIDAHTPRERCAETPMDDDKEKALGELVRLDRPAPASCWSELLLRGAAPARLRTAARASGGRR